MNMDIDEKIINLYKLLINPSVNSNTIISYINNNYIDINTYLPSINNNGDMPLLFHCVIRPDLDDLFKFLIKKNVNVHAKIHLNNQNEEGLDLLIYSDVKYIPFLISKGCTLTSNPDKLYNNIYKLITHGLIKKILLYIKHKLDIKDCIKNVLNKKDLLFDVLDKLYLKVYNICYNINEDVLKTIDELLSYYIDTFKFLFNNGLSPNTKNDEGVIFAQNVLNTYLCDLIKLLIEYNTDFTKLQHYHSNFNQENRQILTPIYNNDNYKKINELIANKIRPVKYRIIKTTK